MCDAVDFFGRKSNFLNCWKFNLCVEANSIRIHTHSEFCIASVPHHLSDCSYFTGITLMASCLGTFKTKEVLKSWNERVCHYLGIQRAEEAVSVLQTVDVSSVEAHWGLTGSLRMASLSTGIKRFPCGFLTERPLVRPSNNIQSCCYFGCSYWLVILIFPLKISRAPCQVFIQVRAEHLQWSVKLTLLQTSQLILSLSRSPWGTKTKPVFSGKGFDQPTVTSESKSVITPFAAPAFFAPFTQHALIWRTWQQNFQE